MASTIIDRVGAAADGVLVQQMGGGIIRVTPGGTVDAIEGQTAPQIGVYVADQMYIMRPSGPNTGPVTVNLETLGSRSLRSPAGNLLTGGELSPNQDISFIDNGDDATMRIWGPF